MASIKIHGGDFVAGRSGTFRFGVLTLPTPYDSWHGIPVSRWEKIPLSKVMRVEAVNKEMRHRPGAAVGRGLVGGMLGWPMGAVASVLGGPPGVVVGLTSAVIGFTMTNHRSNVTFEAEFEGGRRLLATTDTATYTKLLAAAFDYKSTLPSVPNGMGPRPVSRSGERLKDIAIACGAFGLSVLVFGALFGGTSPGAPTYPAVSSPYPRSVSYSDPLYDQLCTAALSTVREPNHRHCGDAKLEGANTATITVGESGPLVPLAYRTLENRWPVRLVKSGDTWRPAP